MKKANPPIHERDQLHQFDLKNGLLLPEVLEDAEETAEFHEVVEGYRLVISKAQAADRNPLNPCSKLPDQIRHEQLISICADIWHRYNNSKLKKSILED